MRSDTYAECHTLALYAECHFAECHFAECRGANWTTRDYYTIKLFTAVIFTKCTLNWPIFNPFHPSLALGSKAGAYQSGASCSIPLQV